MSTVEAPARLRVGRIEVALHALAPGAPDAHGAHGAPDAHGADGAPGAHGATGALPLLLLHALGESAESWRRAPPRWPGPVYALDFAGHGRSDALRGGGYYAELFATHADAALAAIGDRAAIAGAGVGAYVALLVAGARPDRVPAALLLPGRGLAGAGSLPDFERPDIESLEAWEAAIEATAAGYRPGTDPMVAMAERDYRPVGYAGEFAAAARALLLAETAGGDDTASAPPWWGAVLATPRAERVPAERDAAFTALARRAAAP